MSKHFRRYPSAATIVEDFFAQLTALLDTVHDVSVDASTVRAYYADPVRRAAHIRLARTQRAAYRTAIRDILHTAESLRDPASLVSQALLIDWVSTASDFALERLQAAPGLSR